VECGLSRGPEADVICDSCIESARGHGWFYYLNDLVVLIACHNGFTPFFYIKFWP
jgi:hypothetical protein